MYMEGGSETQNPNLLRRSTSKMLLFMPYSVIVPLGWHLLTRRNTWLGSQCDPIGSRNLSYPGSVERVGAVNCSHPLLFSTDYGLSQVCLSMLCAMTSRRKSASGFWMTIRPRSTSSCIAKTAVSLSSVAATARPSWSLMA